MKIVENVTLYRCEYCNKKYLRKYACLKHEAKCIQNPENQAKCYECKYLENTEVTYDDYHPMAGNISVTKKCFECTKYDKLMYPPTLLKIEDDNLKEYLEDVICKTDQEPMPIGDCDGFENIVNAK